MSRKKSYLTLKDQFAGAGGNSQAARRVSNRMGGGLEVTDAMNHWPRACETHEANFPTTRHYCADISSTDPRRFPSTDFLMSSPECTKQGYGDGQKKPKKQMELFKSGVPDPAAERSRATMWDVPRFAEYHKYNYIIVENVPPARQWVSFDTWLRAMHDLGYMHKIVYHNSMFSWPTPQSRDRMYVHFWKKGNKAPNLEFTPPAHCPKCGRDVMAVQVWKKPNFKHGIYGKRGQYVYCCPVDNTVVEPYYYAAINAMDLTDLGKRIGDRKKPLAPNTMRRIMVGKQQNENHPFYIQAEHSHQLQNIKSMFSAFPTQATRQTLGFVFPAIIENKGQSTAKSSLQTFSTFTTHDYHGILTADTFKTFISYYYGGSDLSSNILDSVNTFTTVQGSAIIKPASSDINDWYYRMVKVSEGKRIMNFDEDYIITGSAKEQFIQLGNAVTPSAMEWQIERAVATFN